MTLSELEGRNANGHFFLADLCNYVSAVWPRMTKFGKVTRGAYFHGISHALILRGGAQRPPISVCLGFPTCAHIAWESATKFYTVNKLDVSKNFYRVDHPVLPQPKFLVTQLLMRDLFAVANRLVYFRHESRVLSWFMAFFKHSVTDACIINAIMMTTMVFKAVFRGCFWYWNTPEIK